MPLRWGILSTARINRRVIPAIRASGRSELAGVASRERERAERERPFGRFRVGTARDDEQGHNQPFPHTSGISALQMVGQGDI